MLKKKSWIASHPYWTAGILCLLVGLLSLLPEMLHNGGVFFSRSDYIEQQVAFAVETKRMFQSGAPLWSWNSMLGDNFIGSYAFYSIGSPFLWLVLWLPEHLIPAGLTVTLLLKFMVAGMTSFAYLRLLVKKDFSAVLGSILYTFSGFTIINTQFHFMDSIAVFPLLLYGMEMIFQKERKGAKARHGVFAFAVLVNALINYYFFMTSAMFCFLYFLFRLFSQGWERKEFRRYIRFFLEGLLGVGAAMILLLPAVLRTLGSPRAAVDFSVVLGSIPLGTWLERVRAFFMPPESLIYHAYFPGAASWASVSGYVAVFGLVFSILHVCNHWRRRDPYAWCSWLFIALIVISLIPGLNSVFSLFSSLIYTRWWYGLMLMIALTTARTVEELPSISSKKKKAVFWAAAVFTLLLILPSILGYSIYRFHWFAQNTELHEKLSQYFLQTASHKSAGFRFILVSLLMTACNYGALLWIICRPSKKKILLAFVCCCCVVNYAGFNWLNSIQRAIPYESAYSAFRYSIQKQAQAVTNPDRPNRIGETSFDYRVDFPLQMRSYGIYNNQPSVLYFHSMRHDSSSEFLTFSRSKGNDPRAGWAGPPVRNGAYFDTLLGVKYFEDFCPEEKKTIPKGFVKKETVGGVDIYENTNYIPMGFTYDSYMLRSELEAVNKKSENNDPLRYLLHALAIEDKDEALVKGMLSQYHPSAQPASKLPSLSELSSQRRQETCSAFAGTSRGFTAKIHLSKENLVFFSVPYDENFTATVNGEQTEFVKVNCGLTAIPCKAGENEIVFTYHTPGWKAGIAVSALSCVGLAVYLGAAQWNKKRKREQNSTESVNSK